MVNGDSHARDDVYYVEYLDDPYMIIEVKNMLIIY